MSLDSYVNYLLAARWIYAFHLSLNFLMSIQINYFEGIQELSIQFNRVNIRRYLHSCSTNDCAVVYLIFYIII